MKKISKVVLVALFGLGSIAAVALVQAGEVENCWGRCDTDMAQNIPQYDTSASDAENCWGRCDTDMAQNVALPGWWVNTVRADNEDADESETMASYR